MESSIQSYESGKSKFYIALDTPVVVPVTQAQNSPVAPPRTRHNPFNKPDNNTHHRPYSMRNATQSKKQINQYYAFIFYKKFLFIFVINRM